MYLYCYFYDTCHADANIWECSQLMALYSKTSSVRKWMLTCVVLADHMLPLKTIVEYDFQSWWAMVFQVDIWSAAHHTGQHVYIVYPLPLPSPVIVCWSPCTITCFTFVCLSRQILWVSHDFTSKYISTSAQVHSHQSRFRAEVMCTQIIHSSSLLTEK